MESGDQKCPLRPSFPPGRDIHPRVLWPYCIILHDFQVKKKNNNELIFQTQTLEGKTKVSHLDIHWLMSDQEPVFKHHSVTQNTMN